MTVAIASKPKSRKISNKLNKKRVQVHKMTQQRRWEEINAFIKICFMKMKEEGCTDLKEIANKTQLTAPTIRKFATGEFTLHSKIQTLQAISIAAGLKLNETEYGYKVVIVD